MSRTLTRCYRRPTGSIFPSSRACRLPPKVKTHLESPFYPRSRIYTLFYIIVTCRDNSNIISIHFVVLLKIKKRDDIYKKLRHVFKLYLARSEASLFFYPIASLLSETSLCGQTSSMRSCQTDDPFNGRFRARHCRSMWSFLALWRLRRPRGLSSPSFLPYLFPSFLVASSGASASFC